MILTGSAIRHAIEAGEITFEPFNDGAVNPNSINYRLGPDIQEVVQSGVDETKSIPLPLEDGRFLLRKGKFYLGHTLEIIGSDKYVTSLIGRSSTGRLGLFVQVSANLGHMGAIHKWTLELVPVIDIYLYPGQLLGQVSFWTSYGDPLPYEGWFGQHNTPMPSKHHDPRFMVEGSAR